MSKSSADQSFPVGLVVKLNFLILGLALVVFFIYRLNSGGLPDGVRVLFGLQPSGTASLTWCDTRVKALDFADGSGIEQVEYKWLGHAEGTDRTPLDFIGVEKWFGKNCTVQVTNRRKSQGAGSTDALGAAAMNVHFINGTTESFYRLADGFYLWKDKVFQSAELTQQIDALKAMLPVQRQ